MQKATEPITKKVNSQVEVAQKLYGIYQTILSIAESNQTVSTLKPTRSFLTKTGIDSDEILALESVQDDIEFIKLLFAQFEKSKIEFKPLQLGSHSQLARESSKIQTTYLHV